MIDRGAEVTVKRQAQLLALSRASVYYRPREVSERDLLLMRRIDELHLEAPYYGARKLAVQLRREGHAIGRKHVRTLMRCIGIEALYRKPRTSIPAREAAIYPSLLENRVIERPNEAWASDITYVPMAHGFLYLMAIIDLASRKVLAWRVSNTLTADFCVEALEEALAKFAPPEIFNTDQGSQPGFNRSSQRCLRSHLTSKVFIASSLTRMRQKAELDAD
jgi:putative transposase